MNIDFPLVLVLSVFVTGLIWLVDAVFWAPGRRARFAEAIRGVEDEETREKIGRGFAEPGIVDFSRSLFPVLLIVLVLRSFLVEPFQIPSGSMLPTLQVGDFILVNKYEYGIRMPVIGNKVVEIGDPERGDIIVFRFPDNPRINYIKRVVGLPGDRIRYEEKTLYVNGERFDQKVLAELPPGNPDRQLVEERIGPITHQIYRNIGNPGPAREWQVPAGEYFVMGDNRDHSNDSRYWGTVPDHFLVGRAFAIWVHWKSLWSLPSFKRNGSIQ